MADERPLGRGQVVNVVEQVHRPDALVRRRRRDIEWDEQRILLRSTKSGDEQYIPMGPKTRERLDLYISSRTDDNPALFLSARGTRLSRQRVWEIVRDIFGEFGIKGIGPHDLRHSFATNYMNNPDAREADLKEIGRWKSDTMVRRYSKTGKRARAFEAFQRHNPLG